MCNIEFNVETLFSKQLNGGIPKLLSCGETSGAVPALCGRPEGNDHRPSKFLSHACNVDQLYLCRLVQTIEPELNDVSSLSGLNARLLDLSYRLRTNGDTNADLISIHRTRNEAMRHSPAGRNASPRIQSWIFLSVTYFHHF